MFVPVLESARVFINLLFMRRQSHCRRHRRRRSYIHRRRSSCGEWVERSESAWISFHPNEIHQRQPSHNRTPQLVTAQWRNAGRSGRRSSEQTNGQSFIKSLSPTVRQAFCHLSFWTRRPIGSFTFHNNPSDNNEHSFSPQSIDRYGKGAARKVEWMLVGIWERWWWWFWHY